MKEKERPWFSLIWWWAPSCSKWFLKLYLLLQHFVYKFCGVNVLTSFVSSCVFLLSYFLQHFLITHLSGIFLFIFLQVRIQKFPIFILHSFVKSVFRITQAIFSSTLSSSTQTKCCCQWMFLSLLLFSSLFMFHTSYPHLSWIHTCSTFYLLTLMWFHFVSFCLLFISCSSQLLWNGFINLLLSDLSFSIRSTISSANSVHLIFVTTNHNSSSGFKTYFYNLF